MSREGQGPAHHRCHGKPPRRNPQCLAPSPPSHTQSKPAPAWGHCPRLQGWSSPGKGGLSTWHSCPAELSAALGRVSNAFGRLPGIPGVDLSPSAGGRGGVLLRWHLRAPLSTSKTSPCGVREPLPTPGADPAQHHVPALSRLLSLFCALSHPLTPGKRSPWPAPTTAPEPLARDLLPPSPATPRHGTRAHGHHQTTFPPLQVGFCCGCCPAPLRSSRKHPSWVPLQGATARAFVRDAQHGAGLSPFLQALFRTGSRAPVTDTLGLLPAPCLHGLV